MATRAIFQPPSWASGLVCVILIAFTNYVTLQIASQGLASRDLAMLQPKILSELAPRCCRLAFEHSYGLFVDIPDATWRDFYQQPSLNPDRYRNPQGPPDKMKRKNDNPVTRYIFENMDPWFSCPGRHRLGGLGHGPKFTCNPRGIKDLIERRESLAQGQPGERDSCLVYSFLGGSRDNYRWEESLAELMEGRCEIHIFDYQRTRGKPEWSQNHTYRNLVFHPWHLRSNQGSSSYFLASGGKSTDQHTSLSFRELQKRLGHKGRTIDLFKMDCSGCEWDTFRDWMTADIRQLVVKTFGLIPKPELFFDGLRAQGLELFAKDQDCSDGGQGSMTDWSWIKLSPDFRLNVPVSHS